VDVMVLVFFVNRAMLELNQILRANEINFAILAALPALLAAVVLGWLVKQPFTKVCAYLYSNMQFF
jgi:nuclear-control-of-ATPase protein 2